MLQNIINPLAITFTLATTLGVLVHDTQLDRAMTYAIALPASLAAYAAVDASSKSSDAHVHVERVSGPKHHADLRSSMPRLNPRDDEHPLADTKKMAFGDANTGLWPSI